MNKKVAVVILNYNGEAFLRKFLPGVVENSPEAEVVVVDNCSTDGSVACLRDDFPDVRLIQNESNGGFAKGYNDGLKSVRAEYYLLLNSDVEVTPGWLGPLLALMDSDVGIAAAQPKILSHAEPDRLEYAGAAGGYLDALAYPFCRGRIFDVTEKDHEGFGDSRPVFWATGAALMVRSDVYWALGGFEESFFAHMEEVDLCWRIHRLGKEVYYCGESVVYHVGGGTLAQGNPRKTYLNFRNSLRTLYLNTELAGLLWKMPTRLALDAVAGLRFALSGNKEEAKAVWRAFTDFVSGFPDMRACRRKRTEKLDFRIERSVRYSGSIVFDYFVRGRSKFSDIDFQTDKKNRQSSR